MGFDIIEINLVVVCCGQVEKDQSALYFWFDHGGLKKFKNTIFLIAKLRFSQIFAQIGNFWKKFKGKLEAFFYVEVGRW